MGTGRYTIFKLSSHFDNFYLIICISLSTNSHYNIVNNYTTLFVIVGRPSSASMPFLYIE